jgi:hypothetical protein
MYPLRKCPHKMLFFYRHFSCKFQVMKCIFKQKKIRYTIYTINCFFIFFIMSRKQILKRQAYIFSLFLFDDAFFYLIRRPKSHQSPDIRNQCNEFRGGIRNFLPGGLSPPYPTFSTDTKPCFICFRKFSGWLSLSLAPPLMSMYAL